MYKTIVFFFFFKSFSSLYLLTFLYISIINVKILNISSFYLKIVGIISILHIPPATYQLYRWRVENRDIRVNHASTCIVELLRTCLHTFILHRAPTLSTHTQIQYQCAYGCGRSLCCLDPRTLPIPWELHRSKSLEFPCTARISSIWNSGDNLKVPSKFSYRIHLIKYTYARDF